MELATLKAGGFSHASPPAQVAALATYKAAEYNPMQAPATITGNNPNSAQSSVQRVRLSWEGQGALKNTTFVSNFVQKMRMYCSSGATWAANTGDDELNTIVQDYVSRASETMGVNCSMIDAFGRVGDCWAAERGDAALRIIKTKKGKIKLEEISADRIGELYYFVDGYQQVSEIKLANDVIIKPQEGEYFEYFAGLYFDGPDVVAYKIYQRRGDSFYYNPRNYPAHEILFFKDCIAGGVRGVSKFAIALLAINGKQQILSATIQTMQQQSKVAAISSNNSGGPSDYSYETVVGQDGTIMYQETMADGAIVKYNFNGDSYQVLRAEHPSDAFVKGLKYLDAEACGTVGQTYEFLYTPAESGGAPSRFSFSISSREINRIRHEKHLPKLRYLYTLLIAQGINEGVIPSNNPRIYDGTVNFGVLPTADAFRDSQADIKEDRAGLTDKDTICTTNFGKPYSVVLQKRADELIMRLKTLKQLKEIAAQLGLDEELITMDQLALLGDQPLNDAKAEEVQKAGEEPGKPALKVVA